MTLAVVLLAGPAPMLSAQIWPGATWETATPESVGLNSSALQQAQTFATTAGTSTGGSGYVIKNGKLVWSWGDPTQTYDIKSSTKSFGATALGLAIGQGLVNLNDSVQSYLPEVGTPPASNAADHADWLAQIRFRDLAAHTAGFSKPGGFEPVHFQPGTMWSYSDGGMNWLADALTVAFQNDLLDVLDEAVFDKIGIQENQLTWRNNYYRSDQIEDPFNPGTYYKRREFGSGIDASVDALARFGYLWLNDGQWDGEQIIPASFVQQATLPLLIDIEPSALPVAQIEQDYALYGSAPEHYGLGWWNNFDGIMPDVPVDAFWAWGLHENIVLVVPSLDLVVARTGNNGEHWDPTEQQEYISVLEPFFNIILGQGTALPGDANHDGVVDIGDLQIIGDNWGSTNANWTMADFTGDGVVNLADLQVLGENWSQGELDLADLATLVPEPSTGLSLTAVLAIPASRRWRRRDDNC